MTDEDLDLDELCQHPIELREAMLRHAREVARIYAAEDEIDEALNDAPGG